MDYHIKVAYKQAAVLGECPVWNHQEQLLYWVDIQKGRLNRLDPKSQHNEYISFDEAIGCFAFREQGGFIVALRSGIYLLDDFSSESKRLIANRAANLKDHRFNDGKCDAKGRFWVGTMTETKALQDGVLYCVQSDLSMQEKASGVYTSNGLAFYQDKIFYADTTAFTVYRYDLKANNDLANKTVFFQSPTNIRPARPDGACIDSEGYYWLAMWEGACLLKLSQKGEIMETIKLPVKYPTMPCFGGEDLQTIYITSASGKLSAKEKQLYKHNGKIISIRVKSKGLLPYKFKEC